MEFTLLSARPAFVLRYYLGAGEWQEVEPWNELEARGCEEAAARAIADLPLCVVELDDEMGLALTGGGMDLRWEICEAYTRLGLLPPVDMCELPGMADRGESEGDRYIIAACKRSCELLRRWIAHTMMDLDQRHSA